MIHVSTPGRICLFGEHQDYLGLPVIAAAISLRMEMSGQPTEDHWVRIAMPDINEHDAIDLNSDLTPRHNRDYLVSVLRYFRQKGYPLPHGLSCEIRSRIPINAGTSSSSAMVVNWVNFINQMYGGAEKLSPKEIGEWAYHAEVVAFGNPGGMMDQYSTAIGNMIYLSSRPEISVEAIQFKTGSFVLGDSQEPKDTLGLLGRLKGGMAQAWSQVKNKYPEFDHISDFPTERLSDTRSFLPDAEYKLFEGNIRNREILRSALELLRSSDETESAKIGTMLRQHHIHLRDNLGISTPKIERMIDAAMNEGALGAKINGSGGGGCMFAYAPENPEKVAEAIRKEGGKAWVIEIDKGTRRDF